MGALTTILIIIGLLILFVIFWLAIKPADEEEGGGLVGFLGGCKGRLEKITSLFKDCH